MGIVIGIDVGISTTKIVGIDDNGKVVSPIRIRATDPVTSLYGAFGKYLHDNHIQLNALCVSPQRSDGIHRQTLQRIGADVLDKHVDVRNVAFFRQCGKHKRLSQ